MSAHDCLVGRASWEGMNWELKSVLAWVQSWTQHSCDRGPIMYLSVFVPLPFLWGMWQGPNESKFCFVKQDAGCTCLTVLMWKIIFPSWEPALGREPVQSWHNKARSSWESSASKSGACWAASRGPSMVGEPQASAQAGCKPHSSHPPVPPLSCWAGMQLHCEKGTTPPAGRASCPSLWPNPVWPPGTEDTRRQRKSVWSLSGQPVPQITSLSD